MDSTLKAIPTISQLGLSPHEFPPPTLTVCPGSPEADGGPDEAAKLRVESVLPPMRHLWDEWDRVVAGKFDPEAEEDDPVPWEQSSEAVRQLMQQVRSLVVMTQDKQHPSDSFLPGDG